LNSNRRCTAILEQIDKAYEWLENNGHLLPENCSVIISVDRQKPVIYFGYLNTDDGAALATLFTGHSATRRSEGTSTAFNLTSLGIDFSWNIWTAPAMCPITEEIQF
jgi:hypothetical protein